MPSNIHITYVYHGGRIIYLELGELEEAARAVHAGTTLEMVSLQVQVSCVDTCNRSLSLSLSLCLSLSLSLSRCCI